MKTFETFGIVGYGDFGRLVEAQMSPDDVEIVITEIDETIQTSDNVRRTDLDEVAASDVIVLAVPFDAYQEVVPVLAQKTQDDTLIVDVCSVKMEPTSMFEREGLLSGENVLMTHPLFGPQSAAAGVRGKSLVVTHAKGDRASKLLKVWQAKGIEITEMSAEDHDHEMAKVHVLPFIIGRTLLEMGLNDSSVGTDYYSKLLALMDVERQHSPELFDTIQRHNPFGTRVRSELITNLIRLHAGISVGHTGQNKSQPPMEQLAEYRGALDTIDEALLSLWSLRFGITRNIGDHKAIHDLPSFDSAREEEQQERTKRAAAQLNLPLPLMLEIEKLVKSEVVREHEIRKSSAQSITP